MSEASLSERKTQILELLYEGHHQAQIARRLNLAKSTVSGHVQDLEAADYIREDEYAEPFLRSLQGGTSVKAYVLNPEGQAVLGVDRARAEGALAPNGSPGRGERVRPPPEAEVHNLEVKIPLHNDPGLDLPRTAEMNNWTRRFDPDYQEGVYLEQTTRSLLLRGRGRGPTKQAAEQQAIARLSETLHELAAKHGCELGEPEWRIAYEDGKAKAGVVNHPLAAGQGYEEGDEGVIDGTPEPDTIHPDDPAAVDKIIELSDTVNETHESVQQQADRLDRLEGLVEQLTDELGDLTRALEGLTDAQPPDCDADTTAAPRLEPGDRSPEVT